MRAENIAIISTCLLLISLIQGQEIGNRRKYGRGTSGKRILFGNQANPHDYPFLVELRVGGNFCGGTIIRTDLIMTAAHCVYNVPCYKTQIYPATWQNGNSINPIQCYVHPQYVSGPYAHDIALLRVQNGYLNDGLTATMPLPRPGTNYAPGTPALLVGWGQTQDAVYPSMLLQGHVQIEDWNVCNDKFKANTFDHIDIPVNTLCTQGQSHPTTGTCFGDSGGPVIVNGHVAGVVSFLIQDGGFCRIGTPSMHVSVVDYLPWILSISDP